MTSVIELLLETLKELRDGQLQKFKKVLCDFHRYFSVPLWMLWESTDRQDIVFSVVLIYGQQSVEKTREALMEMKRTDLVQKLSDSSSAPKSKTIKKKTFCLSHNFPKLRNNNDSLYIISNKIYNVEKRRHIIWCRKYIL